ncbi:MAG: tetratricopeptide repeat protein [Planctomycetota bacterium]
MDSARYRRLKEIVFEAADKSTEERRDFLEKACGGDEELRREAERLLREEDPVETGHLLVTPATDAARDVDPAAAVGSRVGPYLIQRVIGSGGMGTVYEAVQDNPRRVVALKVLRAGIASRIALRRFTYETQILAQLRHPAIAPIYEAGTHRRGDVEVPYFAMELVSGAERITAYCRKRRLDTRERLRLFLQACDAVHYGHQKGVIHRDLKPDNLLVDSHGQVRLIDFGIARALDQPGGDTFQTDAGQILGTLEYMSPEQADADGQDIDTRSDVYSLGVLLYEILTGELPYQVQGLGVYESLRVIHEQAPAKPTLEGRPLDRDLELIVLTALEKDRSRRYPSVLDLRRDIESWLEGSPVTARAPSLSYQVRLFARRHKALVTSLASIFVISLIASILIGLLYLDARQARDDAERERGKAERERTAADEARLAAEDARRAESEQRELVEQERDRAVAAEKESSRKRLEAEQVTEFLYDMLSSVDPTYARGEEPTVRSVLDDAAGRLDDSFPDLPLVRASLHEVLSRTYRGLGRYPEHAAHIRRTWEIRSQELGPDVFDTLVALDSLGVAEMNLGRLHEAEKTIRRAASGLERVQGPTDASTLGAKNNLANALARQGRWDEAETLAIEVTDTCLMSLGEEHEITRGAFNTLASIHYQRGRLVEAERIYRRQVELQERIDGPDDPQSISLLNNLAVTIKRQGKLDEAEPLYRQLRERAERVWGAGHPLTVLMTNNLALFLQDRGEVDEVEKLLRKATEDCEKSLSPSHGTTLEVMNNLAYFLDRQKRYDEADPIHRRLVEIRRQEFGDAHDGTFVAVRNYAEHLRLSGDSDAALELVRDLFHSRAALLGDDAPDTASVQLLLASILKQEGQLEEAEGLYRSGVEVLTAKTPTTWETQQARSRFGALLIQLRHFEEAEQQLLAAQEGLVALVGPKHASSRQAIDNLIALYEIWGKNEEADRWRGK